ncbi:MAG: hypothetical protein R3C19_07090 [Planctomycetaceae bacterium]
MRGFPVTETNWLKDPVVAKAVAATPRPSLAPVPTADDPPCWTVPG